MRSDNATCYMRTCRLSRVHISESCSQTVQGSDLLHVTAVNRENLSELDIKTETSHSLLLSLLFQLHNNGDLIP